VKTLATNQKLKLPKQIKLFQGDKVELPPSNIEQFAVENSSFQHRSTQGKAYDGSALVRLSDGQSKAW
jgi:hypothetical protein